MPFHRACRRAPSMGDAGWIVHDARQHQRQGIHQARAQDRDRKCGVVHARILATIRAQPFRTGIPLAEASSRSAAAVARPAQGAREVCCPVVGWLGAHWWYLGRRGTRLLGDRLRDRMPGGDPLVSSLVRQSRFLPAIHSHDRGLHRERRALPCAPMKNSIVPTTPAQGAPSRTGWGRCSSRWGRCWSAPSAPCSPSPWSSCTSGRPWGGWKATCSRQRGAAAPHQGLLSRAHPPARRA